MVHAEGTVFAPAANRTHTEPITGVEVSVNSGADYTHGFGPYVNTGNIAQTLELSVINLTGGTLKSFSLIDAGTGDALEGTTVTVAPNQSVSATVDVTAETLAVGAANGTLSFDVESTWS